MTMDKGARIIQKAQSLGASLAGIASVEQLRTSPSYVFNEQVSRGVDGVGPSQGYFGDDVEWPEEAVSALVVALSHPPDRPELDWWSDTKFKTPGNTRLYEISRDSSLPRRRESSRALDAASSPA